MQEVGIISDREPKIRRLGASPHWPAGFRVRPSDQVEAWVFAEAGARPWARDAVDRRILQEVRAGTGRIIDDEREVGGYPVMAQTRRPFVEADWDLASLTRRDGAPS